MTFADMRGELEQQIQASEARRELLLAVEELRDIVFNAEDLRRPAQEMDLELQTREGIPASGWHGGIRQPRPAVSHFFRGCA